MSRTAGTRRPAARAPSAEPRDPASQRVLWVDGSAGAAGDMLLGALVDLGVPLAYLRRELGRLPLDGWTLRSTRARRASLSARRIAVRVRGDTDPRRWRDVRRLLRPLEPAVRRRAEAIFRRLFEAEAEVHGVPFERVHLHEAGAVDAVIDVAGTCLGLARLGVERVVVSPLTTGFGRVRCAHGVFAVPAPATALLVRGVPVVAGDVEAERLTPTGAAILTTLADAWGPLPAMRPLAVGHGAGERDLGEHPNVLRLILGREAPAATAPGAPEGEVAVIRFAVDDETPQVLAWTAERLRSAGALEVLVGSVAMKKDRAGQDVTVLARPAALAEMIDVILTETGTLGLRHRIEQRVELPREIERVRTPFGAIAIKVATLPDGRRKGWPEYDACAAAARRHRVALREVQQAALAAWRAGGAGRAPRRRR